jgi:hypothetical protein
MRAYSSAPPAVGLAPARAGKRRNNNAGMDFAAVGRIGHSSLADRRCAPKNVPESLPPHLRQPALLLVVSDSLPLAVTLALAVAFRLAIIGSRYFCWAFHRDHRRAAFRHRSLQ